MAFCKPMRIFENAKYIKATERAEDFSLYDPAPLFRKEIRISEDVKEATVLIGAPSFVRVYINGAPITEDLFISPTSDYRKILWYNVYDVTPLLKKGQNAVGVIVGNGFFNESYDSAWHYHTAKWRDAPQFILRLEVNGKTVAVSDGSWSVSRESSHIIYNHLRSGEYVDMRKYDEAWLKAGYDDSSWGKAIERLAPVTGIFKKTACQPIREVEELKPVSIERSANGYAVDFGRTVSGYVQITLREECGREIVIKYTEDIDKDNEPKYNGMDNSRFYFQSPFHVCKLIASGGVDTFKPTFSYYGFRYVIIEGMSGELCREQIKGFFVHQDVERRSDFCSGNDVLNFIYNAGIRSTYSNMFWCLTDCPTREKLGWANDAQASIEQTLINFDIVPLYEKWFEDLKSSMTEEGALPGIIPSPDWGFKCGPICDCMLYELPYKIYLYTGNADMLIGGVPYFDRYVEFLEKKLAEGYDFTLGDWMGNGNNKLIPKRFVFDFYLVKALRVTALAHKLSGDGDTYWEKKLKDKTEALYETYIGEDNRCVINEQSAVAMLLSEELYKDKAALSEQLVEVVERDGMRLSCGMVGVQYLYYALAKAGRADIALKLITESRPGYRTWYENGADTLWEVWDGKDEGSHNHHMFSGVIAWFYKALLGVAPMDTHAGFEKIELCPSFLSELGHCKGVMDTVRGRIEAEWNFNGENFVYTVTLPEGIEASFRGEKLKAGKNIFFIEA